MPSLIMGRIKGIEEASPGFSKKSQPAKWPLMEITEGETRDILSSHQNHAWTVANRWVETLLAKYE